jgi:hypothetical protein
MNTLKRQLTLAWAITRDEPMIIALIMIPAVLAGYLVGRWLF